MANVKNKKCISCNKSMSIEFKRCPHCGKSQAKYMKYMGYLVLVGIVFMVMSLIDGDISSPGLDSKNGLSVREEVQPVELEATSRIVTLDGLELFVNEILDGIDSGD